jgi:hypothetical protein
MPVTKSRPGALIGVAFSGVLLGAILGAITNAVNGWASPLYFPNIMRWNDVQDIWRASIGQGILEGILFGLAFAVIFIASPPSQRSGAPVSTSRRRANAILGRVGGEGPAPTGSRPGGYVPTS